MDFVSSYLKKICSFVGVEKVLHIDASGTKGSPEKTFKSGKRQVDALLFEALLNERTNKILGGT